MSCKNSTPSVGGFGSVVNGAAILITIMLIGAGYFSAIGSFAGVV